MYQNKYIYILNRKEVMNLVSKAKWIQIEKYNPHSEIINKLENVIKKVKRNAGKVKKEKSNIIISDIITNIIQNNYISEGTWIWKWRNKALFQTNKIGQSYVLNEDYIVYVIFSL